MPIASAPTVRHSCRVDSKASALRAARASFVRSPASWRANSRPIPAEAPVMTMVFPWSCIQELPLASWFSPSELPQPLAFGRMLNEFFQPVQARGFRLRAYDPPADGSSVGCRLLLKETPGSPIRPQQLIVRSVQVCASLLV